MNVDFPLTAIFHSMFYTFCCMVITRKFTINHSFITVITQTLILINESTIIFVICNFMHLVMHLPGRNRGIESPNMYTIARKRSELRKRDVSLTVVANECPSVSVPPGKYAYPSRQQKSIRNKLITREKNTGD